MIDFFLETKEKSHQIFGEFRYHPCQFRYHNLMDLDDSDKKDKSNLAYFGNVDGNDLASVHVAPCMLVCSVDFCIGASREGEEKTKEKVAGAGAGEGEGIPKHPERNAYLR